MTIRSFSRTLFLLCGLLSAGVLVAQDYVKDVQISSEKTAIRLNDDAPDSYLLKISGPNDFTWKQEVEVVEDISISNLDANGAVLPDGQYKIKVTPLFKLTDAERSTLRQLTDARDEAGLTAFRDAHKLPAQIDVLNVHFSILNGQFVTPDVEEIPNFNQDFEWGSNSASQHKDYPSMYASLNHKNAYYGKPVNVSPDQLATDNTVLSEDAQVFNTDVVVIGSICVGMDCVNGENFGFDTQRLKENNLRIHFEDTSNSGSFPTTDWRIILNGSNNGDDDYFAIQDATANRIPFLVEGGAFPNTLYVDNNKRVGINEPSPVLELHVTDGDSPGLRLEQDNTSGFATQTWDIAGNETNFFIRDVTHSSKLPLRIRPNAPDNSLYIWNNGNVGLGVPDSGPTQKLHIKSGNAYVESGSLGINVSPTANFALDVAGTSRLTGNFLVTGTSTMRGDESHFLTNGATFFNASFGTTLKIDAVNNRVGIGTGTPNHLLELNADDAVKPNGGSWSAPSDRRLKQNIQPYQDGLAQVLQIKPVRYNYNEKSGYDTNKEHVGIIAQEVQKVAPYMVRRLNPEKNDYLAYDGTALSFMLVNAVKEQQQLIEKQQAEINALKAELSEVDELKAQMDALAKMVADLQNANENATEATAETVNSEEE